MARCGCGSGCGCQHQGRKGVKTSGTGAGDNKITVELEDPMGDDGCNVIMNCVGRNLGQGLQYVPSAHDIGAKISGDAGNTISIGSDGGLMSNGTLDPDLGGVTVASLPTVNLLGAHYGAGYMQFPEGTLKSYEQGMLNENITLCHIPVRRTADRMLFAMHFRNMNQYGDYNPVEKTDTLDTKQAAQAILRPSGIPTDLINQVYGARNGYFGAEYPQSVGLTTLEQVFRVVARRMVMLLEVKDLGAVLGDTASPLSTFRQLIALIQKWGVRRSVIVCCELPTNAGADLTEIKQGLKETHDANIAIGAYFGTGAQMDANPPADLVAAGYTWVFGPIPGNQSEVNRLVAYKTAGLATMMWGCDRQNRWKLALDIGLRGALSQDPVYAAGKTYGFRYKRDNSQPHTWGWGTADYGRYAYDVSVGGAHAKFRGYVDRGVGGILVVGPEAIAPVNSGYHILMGEQCPIPGTNPDAPNNYDIDLSVSTTDIVNQGGGLAMGVFICSPEDVPIYDLTNSQPWVRGYSFVLATNGNFVMRRYDGATGGWAFQQAWASGYGGLTNNTVYAMKVSVRPTTIALGGGSQPSVIFDATTGGGDKWRGAYYYLSFSGRPGGYTGFNKWHNAKVTPL